MYKLLQEREPDLNISFRQVKDFLHSIPEYQRQMQVKSSSHILPVTSNRRLGYVQIDLLDYSQNTSPNQYKYIMNIIDIYSRKCWLFPLKQKRPSDTKVALLSWYKLIKPLIPEGKNVRLSTDQGSEWRGVFQSELEKLNITHLTSNQPQIHGSIERCNQTIRRIIQRLVEENGLKNRFSGLQVAQDT